MWLLALETSTTLFVMGVMLIAFVLMRRSQKRITLSKLPPVSPPQRAQQAAEGHHLDAPGAMSRWEVEMHELARDLSGQLDSKIRIVEQLVQDAARVTARLEAAVARAEQIGLWQKHTAREDDEALEQQAALVQQRALAHLGDTETNHSKPPLDWPSDEDPDRLPLQEPAHNPAAEPASLALDPRSQRVYHLADHGLSSFAIAEELGSPLGDIELILSVRRTHKN